MSKPRLDTLVAERFSLSRTQAAAAIMAGEVSVDGQPARKAGQTVNADASIDYRPKGNAVSRAAGKLAPVLKQWKIEATDKVALDVGASTGGFTQTLLEAGAKLIYAVDVGHGQLAWSLRNDPRVVSMESTDIRGLEKLPEQPDLAVIDVSFISLRQVLPAVALLLPPGTPVIALFKPQFEVGREAASRTKGVIKDETVIDAALDELHNWLEQHGWQALDQAESAVPGSKGNRERLLHLQTPG